MFQYDNSVTITLPSDLIGEDKYVTSANQMFDSCSNLVSIPNINELDVSICTSMNGMFSNCPKLEELDLSGWDTKDVKDMNDMFKGCKGLLILNLGPDFVINTTNTNGMFEGCSSLYHVQIGPDNQELADRIIGLLPVPKPPSKWEYNSKTGLISRDPYTNPAEITLDENYYDLIDNRTKAVINITKIITEGTLTSCKNSFIAKTPLTVITNLSALDTRYVTTMEGMFRDNGSLNSLDLSNFDTSLVKHMGAMFMECPYLTSLNLSSFDTSGVTKMNWMFYYCKSLTSLDLSSFNTRRVTNMNTMFGVCESLTELDLSNFDTREVTEMDNMFYYCKSLTSLDLSSFNTRRVTNMNTMFGVCESLQTLNLGPDFVINTSETNDMFKDCDSLYWIKIRSNSQSLANTIINLLPVPTLPFKWEYNPETGLISRDPYTNTDEIRLSYPEYYDLTDDETEATILINEIIKNGTLVFCDESFKGLKDLTVITNLSALDTRYVTTMKSMFSGCSSLTSLDLTNFNTIKVSNMNNMFSNCVSLLSITLGPNFTLGTSTLNMFTGCSKLYQVQISSNNQAFADTIIKLLPVPNPPSKWNYNLETGLISRDPYTITTNQIRLTNKYYDLTNNNTKAIINITKIITEGTLVFCDESFESLSTLTEVTNLSQLDTSHVTTFENMFSGCSSLT